MKSQQYLALTALFVSLVILPIKSPIFAEETPYQQAEQAITASTSSSASEQTQVKSDQNTQDDQQKSDGTPSESENKQAETKVENTSNAENDELHVLRSVSIINTKKSQDNTLTGTENTQVLPTAVPTVVPTIAPTSSPVAQTNTPESSAVLASNTSNKTSADEKKSQNANENSNADNAKEQKEDKATDSQADTNEVKKDDNNSAEKIAQIELVETSYRHARRLQNLFLNDYYKKLSNIAIRIKARLDLMQREGIDVSSSRTKLNEATIQLENAKTRSEQAIVKFNYVETNTTEEQKTVLVEAKKNASEAQDSFKKSLDLLQESVELAK